MASLSDPLVQELLGARRVAALATENPDGSLHMVAVWYVFHEEHLYMAMSSQSRKARNLMERPKASLMVDSRATEAAYGITVMGTAELLRGDEAQAMNALVHEKYLSDAARKDPRVAPVFAQWDDVTLKLTPRSVIAWDMREADRQVFGNAFRENPGYMLPLDM